MRSNNKETDGLRASTRGGDDRGTSRAGGWKQEPAPEVRADVDSVWDTMVAWADPVPAAPGVAALAMSMKDNDMLMDGTTFTFPTTTCPGGMSLLGAEVGQPGMPAPSPPPNPPEDLEEQQLNFGPLHMSKRQSGSSLRMLRSVAHMNGKVKTEDERIINQGGQDRVFGASSLLQTGEARSQEQSAASQNFYMYKSQLSMGSTVFTLNVGAEAASPGPSMTQTQDASVMSIDALNVNMYMYNNSMIMSGTDFAMDVKNSLMPGALPSSFATAGVAAGDLARLLLLSISSFREAASQQDTRKPDESEDLASVWSWLASWSQGSTAAGAVDINMFMYDNSMSMDNTVFKMNVGTETYIPPGGSGSGSSGGSSSGSSASDSSSDADRYLYSAGYAMEETRLSLDVALAEARGASAQAAGQSINMYMYQNDMQMADTIFTMNVATTAGTSSSLLQTGASGSAAGTRARTAQTLNVKSLNVNMYMLENDMSMVTTAFTWNLHCDG